jgi:biotin transport system permease protein
MGGLMILLLLGAVSAGIKPWELLSGSRPLVIMLLCILLFRSVTVSDTFIADIMIRVLPFSFNEPGFFEGLRFSWAILLSFAAGSLFFSVTTMAELKASLGRSSRISLGISLMLCFIPRFFELWEASNLACEARAGKRGLGRMIIILPLVCERIIQNAAETALALEARGLELQGGKL